QPEYDREIDQRAGHHDHWQAKTGKTQFLQQVGMLDEHVLAAPDDFRKQPPCEYPCAEIYAVRERAVDSRELRPHDLRENDRVDDDHRERSQNRPCGAEDGVSIFRLKFPLDAPDNESAVIPEGPEHRGHARNPRW